MSWLFLPCKKWLCSGWYQGPDMSICLLGHWLLKSPCLAAFQQELQSGSWVTFQREQPTGTKWSPQYSRLTRWADHHTDWCGELTITHSTSSPGSRPGKKCSAYSHHIQRCFLPEPVLQYPGGSLNPPTSVSGHRHATLYPTWIVSK